MRKYITQVAAVMFSTFALLGACDLGFAQPTQTSPLATQSATIPTTAGGTALVLANPSRRWLQICNSGGTNPVWICPAGVTPAANAAGCIPLAPVASNVAACTNFPTLLGINTAAWNAIATGGSTAVTVWEFP